MQTIRYKTGECHCGCGGRTRRGVFLPGHDSRFASALITAGLNGGHVRINGEPKHIAVAAWEHSPRLCAKVAQAVAKRAA